jgi:transcriptional regulator with XRE-family HTH domain
MDFPERLAALRHERDLTQAQLADAVELHVAQIRRYEAGTAQPTLDVIRRLARALTISADLLVFEAARQLDDEGRALVKALIEGIILRQQSRRFANAS